MTWIHDQLFPSLIVLSSIQTGVFADIFHLQKKRREVKKAVKGNKMKNQHPVQAVQTTFVSGVLSAVSDWNCSVPSGDPKWKPTVARQSSEVLEREKERAVGCV